VCTALAAGTVLLGLRALTGQPDARLAVYVVVLATVVAVAWWASRSPVAVLVLALVLPVSLAVAGVNGRIEQSRTFYGTYRVFDAEGMHRLVHGTTVHGTQFTDDARKDEPTTYYARTGPLGDVFPAFAQAGGHDVAVVGLGAGTVAAYGRPGESFTFFEIDPEVVRIAEDKRFFTYLSDSRARVRTVTGDGRLNLARQEPAAYDLILLDAFSSDAIPVHLMTEQAVRLYLSRLEPGGMLVFHISNRVFDLRPVLAEAAESLDLHAAVGTSNATADGATPTQWVALSRDAAVIDRLRDRSALWSSLDPDRRVRWTDDYSSVLSVLR
jgi:protein-L-isoaspartate O-methyltransferase